MHTISMTIEGDDVRVHFNSDWSGQAVITVNGKREAEIPAELFVRVAKKIIDRTLESVLVKLEERISQ